MEAFSLYDPQNAGIYRRNAESYLEELDLLQSYIRKKIALLRDERRVLITAHDAFGYFGRGYGFEVMGLQGISTDSEASVADIRNLSRVIAERRIPAVFVETSISPRYMRALRASVKARGFDVQIGGSLYSDSMGSPGTEEGSYIGMFRSNVDAIVESLEPQHRGCRFQGRSRRRRVMSGGGQNPAAPAVRVTDLTVAYGDKTVLWDIDLEVPGGSMVAVVGPNGAGKTTLIKSIQGLVPRVAGVVSVHGKPYEKQRREVSYVPQRGSVDWDFPTSVVDTVKMGSYGDLGWIRRPGEKEHEKALGALEKVDMLEFLPQADKPALRRAAAEGLSREGPCPERVGLPSRRTLPGSRRHDRESYSQDT